MVALEREVAAHFDERASRYAKHRSWVNDTRSLMPIVSLLRQRPGSVAMEIGAGTGAVAQICASLAPQLGAYIGVDLSHSMLLQHIRHAPAVVGDAHRLPVSAKSIDIIICRQSAHYFDVPQAVLAEIERVLAPNGRLLIAQIVPFADPDDQEWWKTTVALRQPLRRHHWTSTELEEIVRCGGFVIESVQYLQRRTSLKSWLDRYPLDPHVRQELVEHFDKASPAVKELRGFFVNGDEIKYSLQWVFITARLVDMAALDARPRNGAQR